MAARKFLVSIDHSNLESLNLKIQNLAADPSSGVGPGSIYYNTVSGKIKYRNATVFVDPTDRAQHTGTQLAATISDFNTAVRASRLDQMAVPTTDLNINSNKLINVAPGTSGTDAVNKNQLDAVLNGTDWKNSVRAGTTASIALTGLQTVDGISLAAGDRILVKNQTTQTENGIYLVASGAWTRAADAVGGLLTAATSVMIEEGTTFAGTQWRITTQGIITIGSTSIVWAQIGMGVTYTNGAGINLGGNVIAIDTGLVVRKVYATIGNGALTSIPITHNLGNKDVTVTVIEVATDAEVIVDVVRTSTTVVTLIFAVAPASNAYRVIVTG